MTSRRVTRNVVLPSARPDVWDWRLSGACRSADPTLFFGPTRERGNRRRDRENAAKEICAACPVIASCLRHALDAGEPHGVWGGTTATERWSALRTESHSA
ncbi:WhiB family transcriptional regulator [Rhodococcoides trifolii]|uniref:WhiB family transcriptional regulator n=1 Tax=Rhodococcoides trifolii TaxID=908250 RepID=UPI00166BF313|nr:WhiB family transcriptional regulator [Rhodococcus trifolii]